MHLFHSKTTLFLSGIMALVGMQAFAQEPITKAKAEIRPTEGYNAHGTVTFTKVNGGIRVVADIDGLTPGNHGFHVHKYGDCSASDASSVDGIFNPTHQSHGCPGHGEHHVGDLGNIKADSQGHGHYDAVNKEMAFEGENNIIGRGVIVHSHEDDCKTQPAGNSGPPAGCGVIGISR